MKTKISTIKIKATNEVENFKSMRQAFYFCVSKGLCENNNYGFKQKTELTRLVANGVIEYTEGFQVVENTDNDNISLSIIDKRIEKALASLTNRVIDIKVNNKVVSSIEGLQHNMFESILKRLAAKLNVMLVGPAGSGKTTCCANAAKALNKEFYAISVGLQTSKVDFTGYMDASGKYVRTLFREAYENGGIFLIDEIDAGNPGIMTIINAALANDVASFPDAMVKKHPEFLCIAAANTFGKGADRMYVGRNQLDAATLDRFVYVFFDYDESLEASLCTNKKFHNVIKSIRKVVETKKLRIIVSPRATFKGCALIEQGFNFYECLQDVLFNALSKEEIELILGGCNLNKDLLVNNMVAKAKTVDVKEEILIP